MINTPSSQGAIGDLYNFKLDPSLTLGCGTWGGNSVSENVAPHHLLNLDEVDVEHQIFYDVQPDPNARLADYLRGRNLG